MTEMTHGGHGSSQGAPANPYPASPQTLNGLVPTQPSASLSPLAPHQPVHNLASPWQRLGACILDALLIVVTLWIGWFIWTLIAFGDGQTPGKKIVGLAVVDPRTGQTFTGGRMFVREFLVKGLVMGFLSGITFGIVPVVDALMAFRSDRRTIHDSISGSAVVKVVAS